MRGGYVDELARSRANEEYIITLQFELQREKDKNIILEERIRSTEIFIEEMKSMQLELEQINSKYMIQLD